MKKILKKIIAKIKIQYYKYAIYSSEIKKIYKKKNLWKNVKLDKETKLKIKKRYKTKDYWHRYYQYFTDKFDINYFPEILFSTKLELILNSQQIANVLSDKSLLHTLYGNIKGLYIPKTVIQKSYGNYFDSDGLPLDEDNAKKKVENYLNSQKLAIIKPTICTSSGQNVRILFPNDDWSILYKDNFIIQELICNQEDIKNLNPNSLNTMRVITYVCNNEYFIAPIILRMGGGATHLDNAHAGGIFISINDDGTLGKEAYSEYGEKYKKHPYTNIKFENYKISGIDKVKKVAIECHKKTPQLVMISWDLTINKDGVPTLIEANQFGQSIWMSQIAHGKGFFESNTDEMLKLIRKK